MFDWSVQYIYAPTKKKKTRQQVWANAPGQRRGTSDIQCLRAMTRFDIRHDSLQQVRQSWRAGTSQWPWARTTDRMLKGKNYFRLGSSREKSLRETATWGVATIIRYCTAYTQDWHDDVPVVYLSWWVGKKEPVTVYPEPL